MSTDIQTLEDTRLGGFGHSDAEDAQTAGREAVRGALAGRALERDDALAELVRHRGTQFGPVVVDALLALERRELVAAA